MKASQPLFASIPQTLEDQLLDRDFIVLGRETYDKPVLNRRYINLQLPSPLPTTERLVRGAFACWYLLPPWFQLRPRNSRPSVSVFLALGDWSPPGWFVDSSQEETSVTNRCSCLHGLYTLNLQLDASEFSLRASIVWFAYKLKWVYVAYDPLWLCCWVWTLTSWPMYVTDR